MHYNRNLEAEVLKHLNHFPAVVILGARQVGKTTLAKKLTSSIQKQSIYLDLELDSDTNRLSEPEIYFKLNKDKCIIIDEIQRMPELFPLLRAIIDQQREPGRFILLGSANTHLLKLSSESLAGRVSYVELTGLLHNEIHDIGKLNDLWFKGGFPEAYLISNDNIRSIWFNSYIKTITERDLIQLGLKVSSKNVSRFIRMIASNQGGLVNKSNLSRSLGISNAYVNEILDYLEAVFLIRVLEPYHVNIGKRLIKSPKIYIRDSGLMHFMNGIEDMNALLGNQLAGNSWEGFCIEQIAGSLADKYDYYFFRTQDQAESDMVICKGGRPMYCIEFKLSTKPKSNKGYTTVINDLATIENFIVVPECSSQYPLTDKIMVTNLQKLIEKLS